MGDAGAGRVYGFGPFRLDIRECRLSRGSEAIPPRPEVFDTLRVLVENAGRLVTKQALLDAVRPETTVEENNLNHNVSVMSTLVPATCLRAQAGQKEQAIDTFERLVSLGWGSRTWVENDPDYDSLRDDPRFQRLLAQLK